MNCKNNIYFNTPPIFLNVFLFLYHYYSIPPLFFKVNLIFYAFIYFYPHCNIKVVFMFYGSGNIGWI